MAYEYDTASKRYRDTVTGQYVSPQTIARVRDQMIDHSMARIDDLTEQMVAGDLSQQDWRRAMRNEIKQMQINEYLLGRGGRNAMTPADWGRIGAETRKQYQYLDRFIGEIELDTLSDAQIKARARMYTAGSNVSFARGQEGAWSVQLPAHPGDGTTECLNYCRCSWIMTETESEILATWTLGPSTDRCSDCRQRARIWAPLRFDRDTGLQIVEGG